MSIWQKAYETYENHAHMAGIAYKGSQTLTPVGHIVQKAQIELTIRPDGTFVSASELDQKDCKTIIPATERSAARTQAPVPHPLCDQLGYLAPGSQKNADYIAQLTQWANSPYSTAKVHAILNYVKGGTILQDLAKEKLITLEPDGTIASGKTAGTEYEKCMVRWVVQHTGLYSEVWRDQELFTAFQKFQQNSQTSLGLCMISGEMDAIAESHPKGTLATAYGAKLISANDKTGFTYRGRFLEPEQAATIGYQASQKVHSALQWLVANQGVIKGGRTFLCWNPNGKPVVKVFDPWADWEETPAQVTPSNYQKQLADTLAGWKNDLPDEEDVVIAAFEAATTGRLSITHYSEMKASAFHSQLEHWFQTVAFPNYKGTVQWPLLDVVVKCAYGTEQGKWLDVDDRILREHLQRLLCCMTEGAPIPASLVKALCDRASHPLYYKEWLNRARVTHTACALLRKYLNDQAQKEEWTMILDEKNTDRSYLFGRMLALMEYIERSAYSKDETREPNAIRMQSVFCERPMYAAKILTDRLTPYYSKLSPGQRFRRQQQMDEIYGLFRQEDAAIMDQPLKSTYLLGYHLQRIALYHGNNHQTKTEEE